MCQLAAAGQPDFFDVDDVELQRTGPSFTLETVRELRKRGMDEVCWLIGSDSVPQLPTWRQPEQLMNEARIIVMGRPGTVLDASHLPVAFRRLADEIVTAPLIDISATDIRRRVQARRSIAYLVPESVEKYILHKCLYTR